MQIALIHIPTLPIFSLSILCFSSKGRIDAAAAATSSGSVFDLSWLSLGVSLLKEMRISEDMLVLSIWFKD